VLNVEICLGLEQADSMGLSPGERRGNVEKHLGGRDRLGSQESVQPHGRPLGEQAA